MGDGVGSDGIGMTSLRSRERLVNRLREDGISDLRVLELMLHTPRHLFVDEALARRAYHDTALPIGNGQTISQPYIVALMTELLLNGRERIAKVLEIGSGCGYQTAVLARCCTTVYSVERDNVLLQGARRRIKALGLHNVLFANTDGFQGWPRHAPYDGIIVTAAPPEVPSQLLEQLAAEGRLVLPVGAAADQQLWVLRRGAGGIERECRERVHFVPMTEGVSR